MVVLVTSPTYTALDGSTLTLRSRAGRQTSDEPDGFTSIGVATFTQPAIGRLELTAGPRKLGRTVAFDPVLGEDMQVVERYSAPGGEISIVAGHTPPAADGVQHWDMQADGTPGREPVAFALWEGRAHSLHSPVYGPDAIERARGLFEHLRVRENDGGAFVEPAPDVTFFLDDGPVILYDVPDVALLEIMQLTKRNAVVLPRRGGTPVEGGELFVHLPEAHDHSDGSRERHLDEEVFLRKVTASAIVTVLPHEAATEDEVVGLAANLRADWAGARRR